MASKTTTKATSARTNRKNSQQPRKKHSVKNPNRINRQRQLKKQLQVLILERHSRRCIICHHPEREAIEEEFVHWRSPSRLAHDYKLSDYRTVYRHARAAGLLLQRRERLHSALDAFVESVDDVTFTGDTILRAMRAYSCIDSHGRWTEIPTQVQFSTSHDGHPPQPPSPYPKNNSTAASDVIDINPDEEREDDEENEDNAPEERVTALDVLNVIRKYSNQASQSDATASSVPPKIKSRSNGTTCSVSPKMKSRSAATFCAAPPAQAVNVTSDDNGELDDDLDGDEPDDDADEESEEAAENELEEALASVSTSSKSLSRSDTTACAASPAQPPTRSSGVASDVLDVAPEYSNHASRSDATACATSPAQPVSAMPLTSNHRGRTETATACADSPAQALNVLHSHDGADDDPDDNNDPNKSDAESLEETTTSASASSKTRSRSDATACAASPAQSAVPLSSNHHGGTVTATASASLKTGSRSDATACAAPPARALPRDVVRGHNPNDRSPSDRTDCAALPAQPAAPQKPKPDADGLIWHPHPGYPNQEMSEPDAQGRVR